MHSLYCAVEYDGKISLIKLFAEEVFSEKQNLSFTRAYTLKYIEKIAEIDNGVLSYVGGLTGSLPATISSISDLHAFCQAIRQRIFSSPEYKNYLDVEFNKKNRVTAAQFASSEAIANTPRSPQPTHSIPDSGEKSNLSDEISNLHGLESSINKKESSSQYLADLKKSARRTSMTPTRTRLWLADSTTLM